jgi:hypothetical protein
MEVVVPEGPSQNVIDKGKYRRFGEYGPVYKILGEAETLPDGEVMLRVQLVETGEEAQYRLSHAIDDPIVAE